MSDQLLQYYQVLRKSMKYWKKLFLHMVDVAVLNSFLLFRRLQRDHPRDERLVRLRKYSQEDFRRELSCQLGRIDPATAGVPLYEPRPPNPRHTLHIPDWHGQHIRCVVCKVHRPGRNLRTSCTCRACGVGLCSYKDRNCFGVYHSADFDNEL